jgi:predicted secreted protein
MAIQNGTLIKLYDGTTPIALLTSTDMSLEREVLDATSKDSNNWREIQMGLKSYSFTAELFHDESETYNLSDLFDKWDDATAITMKLSSEVTGQKKFTGTVYITNISESAPANQLTTISVTFEGSGALVEATI